MKIFGWLCLVAIVACAAALIRCVPTAVVPVKAAAQDVVEACPLDITVRECLHRLIDKAAGIQPADGGTP